MSEKIWPKWNDFKESVNSSFGKLRDGKQFTDTTLLCKDGQQMEARKVILVSSSPFFEKILQTCKLQRPKKSELSGWQPSTRKNFPDEVRKSRQKKRVNRFSDKKSVRKFFLRQKSVHKSFLQQKSVHKSFLQ